MLYFANRSTERVCDAMRNGLLGQIVTPAEGRTPLDGVDWIADNSAFTGKYPGDDEYLAWLSGHPHLHRCRFAVAPDVVGDHAATLARSLPMLPRIRSFAPAAFVVQNGCTVDTVPWDLVDAVFIGGDTGWKFSPEVRAIVAEANRRGMWAHIGRVNSARRYAYAEAIGCDSADGTYLTYGPDINLPKLLHWTRPSLLGEVAS